MSTLSPRNQVLIIVTSNGVLGATGHSTGLWMEELAAPYLAFFDAGFDVTIASPEGGQAPIDPGSLADEFVTPAVTRFQNDHLAMDRLTNTVALANIPEVSDFVAIFLVGGHGTMWDFVPNAELGRLLGDGDRRGLILAAVCHGVAGLLNAATRETLVRGRALTGFSDEEETIVGLTEVVPFLLQTHLAAAGAEVSTSLPFEPHLMVDGRLVTGQNPASSVRVAEAVLSLLQGPQ